jgi:hypothetical protein
MKHLCVQFDDNQPITYVDNLYFHKPSKVYEIFIGNQQFDARFELKIKIVDFHIQRIIQLEVANNSKLKLIIKYKDSNCP